MNSLIIKRVINEANYMLQTNNTIPQSTEVKWLLLDIGKML